MHIELWQTKLRSYVLIALTVDQLVKLRKGEARDRTKDMVSGVIKSDRQLGVV